METETLDFLRGVIAPMYTPVHRDGALDLVGAAEMVRWLESTGVVRSVFARSGMGRMFTFTEDETRRFAQAVRDAASPGTGMLLGAGGEWLGRERGEYPDVDAYTQQAIRLTRFAKEIGADAAVHVIPFCLRPRREESPADVVIGYYEAVHESTDLPLVIYQPGGVPDEYCLSAEMLRALLAFPRICGMKMSTTLPSVFDPIAEVVRGVPFALICGHEGYYAEGLAAGASGVIGQGCNGYPEVLYAVQRRYWSGDRAGALSAQQAVGIGLEATAGLDSSVAMKQYFASKGFAIQPYDRSGATPYPGEVMDGVCERLDRLRSAYPVEV